MSSAKVSITYFLYFVLSLIATSAAVAEWDVVGAQEIVAKDDFFKTTAHAGPKAALRPPGPVPKFNKAKPDYFHSFKAAPPSLAKLNNSKFNNFRIQAKSLVAQQHKITATIKLVAKAPFYALSISGSLKQNLERILGRYHWILVWKAPYDYNFYGRLIGTSMPDVMEKLMTLFPLQAVIYMANKTILIVPRHQQND